MLTVTVNGVAHTAHAIAAGSAPVSILLPAVITAPPAGTQNVMLSFNGPAGGSLVLERAWAVPITLNPFGSA